MCSAGTNITLHKDSAFKESWSNFKDNSKAHAESVRHEEHL